MLKLNRFSASVPDRSGITLSHIALRAVAVATVFGAGIAMSAQTSAVAASQSGAAQVASSASSPAAWKISVPAKDELFSSSADEETASLMQPAVPEFSKMVGGAGSGQGQAYGRPRYRSAFTNDDGSLRYVVYGGAGATVPVAATSNHLTPNFSIQAGVGPRFNQHLSLPVEFDWDQFGFTKSTLDGQIAIYDSIFGGNAVRYLLDGNSHIWSFSLQPTYTFYTSPTWGAYVKAGVGFYHKVANFTLPSAQVECYYFCGIYEANYNLDHYTSNAPGYDAGVGFTYKLSPDSHARLYMEARYVFIDNQQRYGIVNTPASIATVSDSTTDFYPANSNRTEYIPITVGIRF